MNFQISIGHPAQFHLFRDLIISLREKNHKVFVLITTKELVQELCQSYQIKYDLVLSTRKKSTLFQMVYTLIKRTIQVFFFSLKNKPDVLVGSEVTFPLVGKLLRIPTLVFSEDDAEIIPEFVKIAYPFATSIISPSACDAGKYNYKKIAYNGYQKLVYLHPDIFKPSDENVYQIINKRFFLLRFSGLSAYHDKNKTGLTHELAQKIINLLEPFGDVYISSEVELPEKLLKYKLKINPTDIHKIIYYADLFIGDSQSMAVEASLLGTPNIRFNDFVGKIGVLEELEKIYHLTLGIDTKNGEMLLEKINQYLNDPEIAQVFKKNHKKLISEKINVYKFFEWFLLNYPNSSKIIQENPDYQYNFK